MKLIKNKAVFGWVWYDWANSAFATTVMAGFFPIFFKTYWSAGTDVNQSTAFLGFANSLASLLVALLSPVLGAIADQSSGKKKFLIFFAYLSVLMTGCLFMVGFGYWVLAAILYVVGTVGFSGANIFYDSLLTEVTTEKNIDYISSKGFAFGYLGGGLLFLINVLWYLMPASFGFPVEETASIEQRLYQNARTIQVGRQFDFSIPPEKEVGEAIITSEISSPIEIQTMSQEERNRAIIKVQLPADVNLDIIEKKVSFGEYKTAEVVAFQSEQSSLELTNLTRKLQPDDKALFILRDKITFQAYQQGTLQGVQGLENHYENIQIKSDFLPPAQEFLPIRASFVSVAIWWGLFTIPLILFVKERKRYADKKRWSFYISQGFTQLGRTFKKVRHMKVIFVFLIGYWMYIDGVNTIIKMAVDYGMSIGFPSSSLIVALLITQFVGFPAALVFGVLGERWDVKKSIFITIAIYILVTFWGVFMTRVIEFYVLAIVIGLVQGGIQALSRSYYSRIIPKDQSAEFYGFYNMVGKFAAIFGPTLIAIVNISVKSLGYSSNLASRAGIGSICLLFIGGGILLYFVDELRGKEQVSYLRMEE